MTTFTQQINILQEKMVKILVVIVVLLMFGYLYFVNSTAFGAASYENITAQITNTQSQIGELELTLINEKRSINRRMAEEFALISIEESDSAFARRDIATRLTINE